MDNCIFCQIIEGNAPSYKIYEDDRVIAILVNRPIRQGHAMVFPKTHIDHFINLDDDLAAHICKTGNDLGRKMQVRLNPLRVGFVVSGFGVAHAHYHVIPLWDINDISSSRYTVISGDEIIHTMDHIPVADDQAQMELVQHLKI